MNVTQAFLFFLFYFFFLFFIFFPFGFDFDSDGLFTLLVFYLSLSPLLRFACSFWSCAQATAGALCGRVAILG